MPFALGDVENDCLIFLGSSNPLPNYGGYPNFAGAVTPLRYSQQLIDTAVNRSVQRILSGLRDIDLVQFSYTFPTTSQIYKYAIPQGNVAQGNISFAGTPTAGATITVTVGGTPYTYTITSSTTSLSTLVANVISGINQSAIVTGNIVVPVSPMLNTVNTIIFTAPATGTAGNAITLAVISSNPSITVTRSGATLTGGTASSPNVVLPKRVYYQPYAMIYQREKAPGNRLISWEKFQLLNGGGYMQPYSFAVEPDFVTITPDRQFLQFWPGPVSTGDLVTFSYVPSLTTSTGQPVLVNQSDIVPLPDDLRDLVTLGAMMWLYPAMREFGLLKEAKQQFNEEMLRVRYEWQNLSAGDNPQIIDAGEAQAASGWLLQ